MGVRWPREMFGVQIVYIRDHVARQVSSIVPGGRGVWAVLADGRVGTNDAQFFQYACPKGSQAELQVAEKLWRLGKLKKSDHQKLAKAYEAKKAKSHASSVASDLKHYARQIGLPLTKDQERHLEKLAA